MQLTFHKRLGIVKAQIANCQIVSKDEYYNKLQNLFINRKIQYNIKDMIHLDQDRIFCLVFFARQINGYEVTQQGWKNIPWKYFHHKQVTPSLHIVNISLYHPFNLKLRTSFNRMLLLNIFVEGVHILSESIHRQFYGYHIARISHG